MVSDFLAGFRVGFLCSGFLVHAHGSMALWLLLGMAQLHAPIALLQQSMYIRVKRLKATYFLHVEPSDTVLEVKSKLQELLEQVKLP